MKSILVYPVGTTEGCAYAAGFLKAAGIALVDHPTPEVTHLLLDVPSFSAPGILRGGGALRHILSMLPPRVTVIGGNLKEDTLTGYKTLDLLQDAHYLARNAAITAHCALQVAAPLMKTTFADTSALVLGWGRIGKCLARLLKAMGAEVTVATRKETDRAMLLALGYRAVNMSSLAGVLPNIRLVFNTVPEMILPGELWKKPETCVAIDLASRPGIEGSGVVWARGLPGVYAPESSGRLIADTIIEYIREEKP